MTNNISSNTVKNTQNPSQTLTLKQCESYLYDGECAKRHYGRALSELFVNSRELMPSKPVIGLPHYRIHKDKLVELKSGSFDFTDEITELECDTKRCFVLECHADVFTGDEMPTAYLVNLEADFIDWDAAIILRSEEGRKGLVFDHVSDSSDFLSETFFKRFFINFPFFLTEHGIKAAYPVLAKKSLAKN